MSNIAPYGSINKEFKCRCQVDDNYPGDDASISNPGVFLSPSHGANLDKSFMDILLHKSSVAFFMFFMVKGSHSGRHIYAGNKAPSLAIDQSKNSISENFPQCKQCPKPDNLRPDKAILPGKSLERNNSLSLEAGLLYGAMLVCNCPTWFYRDIMAV